MLCVGAEMGANLPAVDLGPARTAVSIALGEWHTCVILVSCGRHRKSECCKRRLVVNALGHRSRVRGLGMIDIRDAELLRHWTDSERESAGEREQEKERQRQSLRS